MILLTTLILTSIWFSLLWTDWLAEDASLCSKYENISRLILSRNHPSRPNWRIKNLPGPISSPRSGKIIRIGRGEFQPDRNNPGRQPGLRVCRWLSVSTILPWQWMVSSQYIYGFLQANKSSLELVLCKSDNRRLCVLSNYPH